MSKFGLLGKITLFQDIVSTVVSNINPAIVHNVGKYMAIKKAFYLSSIERVKGDYYEFGVYTGSSFTCAIRCSKRLKKYDIGLADCCFFGFDSFSGFGKLNDSDKHSFYTDINFKTSYDRVYRRINKLLAADKFELVEGLFEETLHSEPKSEAARIVFIDCDTYSSTQLVLNYIKPILQAGTLLILDDYFSYKGSLDKGVCGAFKEFTNENNILVRTVFHYGMGGVVKIIASL